jgi:hypothetical protein
MDVVWSMVPAGLLECAVQGALRMGGDNLKRQKELVELRGCHITVALRVHHRHRKCRPPAAPALDTSILLSIFSWQPCARFCCRSSVRVG